VGAINVDGCRVGTNDQSYFKTDSSHSNFDGTVYGFKDYEALTKRGGGNPQGRFPANLCHDGSPEVVGLFPVTKGDSPNRKPRKQGNGGSIFGICQNGYQTVGKTDSGSAARFFYTAKATKKERLTFNNHPTVKPVSLMQYLVRLITPAGGTCLDPFAGSGTTGLACMKEGRDYILIDADSQSLDIARRRLLSEIASQEYRRAARRRLNTHRSQLQIF
jgi:site-specific DNA-methyltransferase (adenine-specific)